MRTADCGMGERLEARVGGNRAFATRGVRARLALACCVVLAGLVGCAAGGGGAGAGAGTAGASAVGIVEGVERERFAAMVAGDRVKLERVLGESLKYCHSNGNCETKAQFMANLASGQMKYKAIQVLELQLRPVGSAMLVQGRIAIEAEQAGQPLSLKLVYTDVYESRGGVWQMVAWQSTRLP